MNEGPYSVSRRCFRQMWPHSSYLNGIAIYRGQRRFIGLRALHHCRIDTSLRVLPLTPDDVQAMLAELQGAKLLRGARGSKPADMHALVEVIYRVADLAQGLRADLESLEINPLRVDGSQIEALDAVITWLREQ